MRKLPLASIFADSVLTAFCVIACVCAMPTAYEAPYVLSPPVAIAILSAFFLCTLIHLAKKAWLAPCALFAVLIVLYGLVMRDAIRDGAKLLWYSAASLWSLDFSFLPTPSMPDSLVYPEAEVAAFMILAAGILSLITAILLTKPKTRIPALLVPVPFFAVCFIYTDCRPAFFTIVLLVIYWVGVLFGPEILKKDARAAGKGRALFVLLLTAGAVLLTLIAPEKKFEPIPFAERRDFLDTFGLVHDTLLSRQYTNPKQVDLTAEGERSIDDEKAFSVNCSTRGVFLLRTHSYGRYIGNMWNNAQEYTGKWESLEALGSTQTGRTAYLRIRDAYMSERLVPYAFSEREDVALNESFVRANGRSAYVWQFLPNLMFTAAGKNYEEDKYYNFAVQQYTLPEGSLKSRLLEIAGRKFTYADWVDMISSSIIFVDHSIVVYPDQPYLTALSVADYVRNSGTYTLSPGKTPLGEDFVEYFLIKSHKGYCVHFASATTAILQALGIPARYVVGYRVEITRPETWIDVPRKTAHAWTEVYIKGVGWVPIESSAGYPSDTGYTNAYEPQVPEQTEQPAYTLPPYTLSPRVTPEPTEEPTPRPSRQPHATDEPVAPVEKGPNKWIGPLAIAVGAIAAWEGVGAVVRARRKRRFTQENARQAVLAMLNYLGSIRRYGGHIPEDADTLRMEAAFSNHPMKGRQEELLRLVRKNRAEVMKYEPLKRFVLRWVIFRL